MSVLSHKSPPTSTSKKVPVEPLLGVVDEPVAFLYSQLNALLNENAKQLAETKRKLQYSVPLQQYQEAEAQLKVGTCWYILNFPHFAQLLKQQNADLEDKLKAAMTSSLSVVAQLKEQVERLQQRFVTSLKALISSFILSNTTLISQRKSLLEESARIQSSLNQEQEKVRLLQQQLQEKDSKIASLSQTVQVCRLSFLINIFLHSLESSTAYG